MNESITSTATVATDRPGRYGKQLVSHLSRRSPGTWDEETSTGEIRFADGIARLAVTDEALELELTTGPDLVDRLEDVLGRHLVRFATQDVLDVRWSRSDGTAGSRQTSAAGAPDQGDVRR